MYKNIKYRWTDAWLLASIALAGKDKPAELWEILYHGDLLNRTIFTPEEIESGLVRLTKGGWIEEKNDLHFIVTNKFSKMRIKIVGIASIFKLRKILQAEPWTKDEPMPHPDNNLQYPGITREILIDALKKYKKNYHKIWQTGVLSKIR